MKSPEQPEDLGYCIHCRAKMWRDLEGRVRRKNPEPDCACLSDHILDVEDFDPSDLYQG